MVKKRDRKSYLWVISFGVAFILIILAILFFSDKSNPDDDYMNISEIPLGNNLIINLTSELNYLTKCLEVNGILISERPDELKDCPNVLKENIKLFNYLNNNVSGNVVCNSFYVDNGGMTCKECENLIDGCKKISSYDWITPNGGDKRYYYLYQCKENYYYTFAHTTPSECAFMSIEFDEDKYRKIVYGLN